VDGATGAVTRGYPWSVLSILHWLNSDSPQKKVRTVGLSFFGTAVIMTGRASSAPVASGHQQFSAAAATATVVATASWSFNDGKTGNSALTR